MKYILLSLVALVLSINTKAQDTVYLDADYKEVEQGAPYEFYKVVRPSPNRNNVIIEDRYFKSGVQEVHNEFHVSYFPRFIQKRVGEERRWYESGQLKWVANFVDGEMHGTFIAYWENGRLKRKDLYKRGKLKKGEIWDENGEKAAYVPFIKRASCEKWSSYMMDNLRYPPKARKNKIQGYVLAEFLVDEKGEISNIKIVRSVDPELDAEVIRLIKNSPPWSPLIIEGVATSSNFTLPILFRLELDD